MCRNCDEFGICQNKCVLEKNVYVTVGRVSGNEDILMFIDAYISVSKIGMMKIFTSSFVFRFRLIRSTAFTQIAVQTRSLIDSKN